MQSELGDVLAVAIAVGKALDQCGVAYFLGGRWAPDLGVGTELERAREEATDLPQRFS